MRHTTLYGKLTAWPWFCYAGVIAACILAGCGSPQEARQRSSQSSEPSTEPAQPSLFPLPPDDLESRTAKASRCLSLRLAVDAEQYRVGDPIALEAIVQNHGTQPYLLVLPVLRNGQTGFGVRLTMGSTVLLNSPTTGVAPQFSPGFHPFTSLAPGSVFHSSTCFQDFILGSIDLPLAEGHYSLVLTFDPSGYQDVFIKGERLLVRMQSQPVQFSVKGPPRTDAHEILELIGTKARIPHLERDLIAEGEQRDAAWHAVRDWGDSRLEPYLEHFINDHPDIALDKRDATDLRPFNFTAQGETTVPEKF
jgi:hypothetical protein